MALPITKEQLRTAVFVEEDASYADYSETLRLPMDDQLRSGKLIGPFCYGGSFQVHERTLAVLPLAKGARAQSGYGACTALDALAGTADLGKIKEGATLQSVLWGERGVATREQAAKGIGTLVACTPSRLYIRGTWQPPTAPIYLREALRSLSASYLGGLKRLPPEWMPDMGPCPRLQPLPLGLPACADLDTSAREVFAWVVGDNDLIGVQGPPGTGKTHLLARIAAYFLGQGLTVGILGNANLGVNNALNACAEECARLGLVTTIGKNGKDKSLLRDDITCFSRGTPVPACWGATMAAATGFYDRKGDADLANDPVFRAMRRDILLIDEAGQVLAYHMAACAYLAPRTILFGDDNQLPPILRGTHTDAAGLGLSAMQFLVERRGPAWVRPLLVSHRMNRELCRQVQVNFYEDLALAAGKNADARVADLPSLSLLRVSHNHRSNRSHEEVTVITELVQSLLGKELHLPGEEPRPLAVTDIMVLAPYRCQVRALSDNLASLGLAQRVGTVDRMQGQGAPVIIYSATASSLDTLGDQAEWYFQTNRWNVMVSRAIAACIVVANADMLLAAHPTTLTGLVHHQKISKLLLSLPEILLPE